jgi:hypothetical protein
MSEDMNLGGGRTVRITSTCIQNGDFKNNSGKTKWFRILEQL